MKKILFITPFAPSNIGAAMKFTKKTIEALAQNHQIDLIYFMAEGESPYSPDSPNINVIKSIKVTTFDRLLSIASHPWLYPIFSVRYKLCVAKEIRRHMKLKHYDLMFLDHSQTFIYGKTYPNIPKILMSHDVIYQRVTRSKGALFSAWCHHTEKVHVRQPNSHVFSFSTKDKQILDQEYCIKSDVTCGNIDDLAYHTIPTHKTDTYLFFGQWVRKDNLDGLEWFLKHVYPKTPTYMTFKIIGRGLPQHLQEYVNVADRIQYCGFIDNPYQEIANSRAVLSPLFTGAGVKFKVLESIACGTPVIGTEIAFEGIPQEYSSFMQIAHTPEEYIYKMQHISYSIDECIAMKRKFIENYINPSIIQYINSLITKKHDTQ